MMVEADGDVFGFIKEANTFGKEGVPWLHAVIKGRFDKDTRELRFTKTYDGSAEVVHGVQYRGTINTDGDKIRGTWEIPGDWGADFSLQRTAGAEPGRFPATGVWAGTYSYPPDAERAPVKFWMIVVRGGVEVVGFIKEPNTFGEGDDPWLHAVVKGRYDPEERKLIFTKTYDGTSGINHDVSYEGRLSGDAAELSGTWDIPGVWNGKFTAQKVPPADWGKLKLTEPVKVEKRKLEKPHPAEK